MASCEFFGVYIWDAHEEFPCKFTLMAGTAGMNRSKAIGGIGSHEIRDR